MAGKSNGGEVEYLLVADDSNLDSDLEKANQKVKKAAKKSADESVKIEEEKTKDIKKESDKVVKNAEKSADDVVSEWKDAGKEATKALSKIGEDDVEFDVNANTSKAESKIKSVSKDKSIDVDVNADVSDAEDAIKGLDDVAKETGDEVGASLSKNIGNAIKSSFTDAADSSIPLVSKIGELTSGLSGAQVAAIGAGAAAAGMGALAVGAANDMQGAMNSFIAETGKSREETKRYQGILENIYANNYGESFEDIASAMAEVRTQIGPVVDAWDDTAIQGFTESAFALRDTFGYDITESVRAANTMMEQFGMDGQDAFDLIATGAQNGLDYSGELLDSINEYSVQFAKMGLYGEDMFAIFQKGADSGAFNLDKVGETGLLEFVIGDSDGNHLASIHIVKSSSNDSRCSAIFQVQAVEKGRVQYEPNSTSVTNRKNGQMYIQKSGDLFDFYFGGKMYSYRVPEAKDKNALTITIFLGNYGTSTTPMYQMLFGDMSFQKNNVEYTVDIPNRYQEGDVITVDGETTKMYVNGIPMLGDEVKGSRYFHAKPGKTKVQFYVSEFCEPKPEITARIREAWL